MALADGMLGLINELTPGLALKFNKHYIGLAREGVADNFLTFGARKEHLVVEVRIARADEVSALIDDSPLDSLPYDKRWGRYRIRLTKADLAENRSLLLELIRRAHGAPDPVDD